MGVSVTNSSKDWEDFWYNSEDITDLFDNNQSRIVDDKVTCFIFEIRVFSGITESNSILYPVKQKLRISVKSSSPHKWIPVTPFSCIIRKCWSPLFFNSRNDSRVRCM